MSAAVGLQRVLRRGARAQVPLWTPASLSAVRGLYLPNRLALSNGAAISSLADSAGVGPSLTGTAVTYDTGVQLRGRGVAKFLSGSSSALVAETGGVSSGSHTIAVVARFDAIPAAFASAAYLGAQYPGDLSAVGISGSEQNAADYWYGHSGSATPAGGPTEDTQFHLWVKRYNADTGKVDGWLDGRHVVRNVTATPTISAGIGLGGAWAAGFDANKRVACATFTGAAITLAELVQLEAWAFRETGLRVLFVLGDSIAQGLKGGTNGDIRSLLAGWSGHQSGTYYRTDIASSYNLGIEGQSSDEILARVSQVTDHLPGSDTLWVRGAGIRNDVVLSSGTNDLNEETAWQTARDNAFATADAIRAVGGRVIMLGCLSDPNNVQPASYGAARASLNAAYGAAVGVHFDAYVDPDDAGEIGRDPDDDFHPVDYGPLAALVSEAL